MGWTKKPFIEYLNTVDDILETVFGVTSLDMGTELISSCHEAGERPEACVQLLAEKHDLVSVVP